MGVLPKHHLSKRGFFAYVTTRQELDGQLRAIRRCHRSMIADALVAQGGQCRTHPRRLADPAAHATTLGPRAGNTNYLPDPGCRRGGVTSVQRVLRPRSRFLCDVLAGRLVLSRMLTAVENGGGGSVSRLSELAAHNVHPVGSVSPQLLHLRREALECDPTWSVGMMFVGSC